MENLILYHIFICWVVAIASSLPVLNIFRHFKKDRGALSYGYFWFFVAVLWFLVGLRLLFVWLECLEIDRTIFYLDQIVVAGQMIAGAYYLTWIITKNVQLTKVITGLYGFCTTVMLIFTFKKGLIGPSFSVWGTKYILPPIAWSLFAILEGLLVLIVFINILHYLFLRITRKRFPAYLFLALLALLIYGIGGYFDEKGFITSWQLLFIRVLLMVSALIGYLAYTSEEAQEKIS